MSDRDVISDALCAQLEPLLPSMRPRRGGRWTPHRMVQDPVGSLVLPGLLRRSAGKRVRIQPKGSVAVRSARWAEPMTG